jgi:hypothetical protein
MGVKGCYWTEVACVHHVVRLWIAGTGVNISVSALLQTIRQADESDEKRFVSIGSIVRPMTRSS